MKITNERYLQVMSLLKLTPEEVQGRLVQHWKVLDDLNAHGVKDIDEALKADPRPSCLEDLEFLRTSFQVGPAPHPGLGRFSRGDDEAHGFAAATGGRQSGF